LNAWVTDLVDEVRLRVHALGATTLDEIRRAPERLVALSARMEAERAAVKEFLYTSLYNTAEQEQEHERAQAIIAELFAALMAAPEMMPSDHQAQIPTEGLARTVADYIAGMTDGYIVQLWKHSNERQQFLD
jgi:dGTPase